MKPIRFSLAQIEAFASVCECGTLTHAAKKLKKDRTTISELVDYLELDLGYALFDRSTRPLSLTDAGKLLYRQARLFLHEAQAFGQIAEHIPQQLSTQLTLCYDAFTPRDFLLRLADKLHGQQIHLNLIATERANAEQMLEKGEADIGLFQAMNRSINERFQWKAIGGISLAVYAKVGFFHVKPVSLLSLASGVQLMPFKDLPPHMAQRLQIADRIQSVTEISMLKALLTAGYGWGFLPTHLHAEQWPDVERLEAEFGDAGLSHPLVALWDPAQKNQPTVLHALSLMSELFSHPEDVIEAAE